MGCRKNWPALCLWIWEYGNAIDMMKSKQEGEFSPLTVSAMLRLTAVSAERKLRKQRRRVEKPLLHKVLLPARFKASDEGKSPATNAAALAAKTDVVMTDAEITAPLGDTASDTSSPRKLDAESTPAATTEDANNSDPKVNGNEP